MLNPQWLKDQPQLLHQACQRKHSPADIDTAIHADQRRREIIAEEESLQNERNTTAKEIGRLKKSGEDTSEIQARMKTVGERVAHLAEERRALENTIRDIMLRIPNLPAEDTPHGDDESGNVIVHQWGQQAAFDFDPRPHWELGERLGLFDLQAGAKIAGSGFVVYTGLGARLERALVQFFLDLHTGPHGYTEIYPPSVVNAASMTGTGNLPKFADDAYVCDREDGLYLIPTAEVPVTNLHRDEILGPGDLPKKYAAYSSCFRREAGSAGKDTRGLLRVHEFHKVELVRFCAPENSPAEHLQLRDDVAAVFEALGLHYRIVSLCDGDLGFSAAKCFDFEVWAPGVGKYLECSSCSNFTDYQARRINLRYRDPATKTTVFPHTLNASGVACPRTMVAILETFQQADGSVLLPEPLRPYMNGRERIEPRA